MFCFDCYTNICKKIWIQGVEIPSIEGIEHPIDILKHVSWENMTKKGLAMYISVLRENFKCLFVIFPPGVIVAFKGGEL